MPKTKSTASCPYGALPDTAYWRRSVPGRPVAEVDPVVAPRLRIKPGDRLATAGSCFAQHIARYLKQSGFDYFVAEPGHAVLSPELASTYNYGTFSARYGNIYTTRQLLQMFQRAYGLRRPVDDIWPKGTGFIDPFRPYIQPEGFATRAEFDQDRAQHFAAVRRIVEQSDVFVFTLGLTECWENATDGTVYAICPGCGEGSFDPALHRFRNLTVTEVINDLAEAIAFLTERNPAIRILLTVSPVPLIASYSGQHALSATSYSKSVLRVAAQAMLDRFAHVDYFPSYEIITGPFNGGAYYEPDLREVTETGVAHAMRCFFRHYLEGVTAPAAPAAAPVARAPAPARAVSPPTASEILNKVVCDEERLDNR